jgi:hypothetical protein
MEWPPGDVGGKPLSTDPQDETVWCDYQAECKGCDLFGPVDDNGLCAECTQKLERDLLRQRSWDYSHAAYALAEKQREELRNRVIAKYGQRLELLAEETPRKKKRSAHRSRRRKS